MKKYVICSRVLGNKNPSSTHEKGAKDNYLTGISIILLYVFM